MAISGLVTHDGGVTVFDRNPRLRWAVPATLVALIVGGTLVGSVAASADSGLPPLTAQELLVQAQAPNATSVSGTVEATADLGLPELPMSSSRGANPTAMLSGTNTARVWSDGAGGSRVALLADADEYDIVRNGQDVWAYSNADRTVEHYVLPDRDAPTDIPANVSLPSTPQEAATQALAAIDSSTAVTTSGVDRVAGRDVYELILTPKSSDTLVAKVVIAMDGETYVPLRVQVYSTQMQEPAFEIGFTSVDFGAVDPALFAFTPPAGATVTEHPAGSMTKPTADAPTGPKPVVVGTGWSTVAIMTVPADALAGTDSAPASDSGAQAASMLQSLPTTSGAWGSGKVLEGTLFTAILTDDGRLAIGAVSPTTLGAALAAS